MNSDNSMMGMTVTQSYYDPSGMGARWFKIAARWNGVEDEFVFCIPVFEGFKHPNKTINWYYELALESVNNYRRRFSLRGGQSHIFDFVESGFIPRENIDWP